MSTFLVYLYKKKPLRALKHPYTSIHPYTKFCAQILCSNSVLKFCATCAILLIIKLSCVLATIFSPVFTWAILLIVHSALWGITSWAQRAAEYYLLGTAHCGLLPLGHTEVTAITSYSSTYHVYTVR